MTGILIDTPWGKMVSTEAHDRSTASPLVCASAPDDRRASVDASAVTSRTANAADLPAVPDARASGTAFCYESAHDRSTASPLVCASAPDDRRASSDALSDDAVLFIRLIAAHHRCDAASAIERASAFYCEKIIGLQRMCDLHSVLTPHGASRLAPDGAVNDDRPAVASFVVDDGCFADLPAFERVNAGRFSASGEARKPDLASGSIARPAGAAGGKAADASREAEEWPPP